MDTDSFVRSEQQSLRTKFQSLARQSLINSSDSMEILNKISSKIISERNRLATIGQDADEIDKLVLKVIEGVDDPRETAAADVDDKTSRENQPQPDDRNAWHLDSSHFWTYVLAIPIIFTHGIATRMQFQYGGLYGRDGLNLSNAAAILATGCTAMGRATAPPLLLLYFNQPYFFMFLNFTTLLGCAGMLLIPVIGGRGNFDEDGGLREGQSTGLGTVIFYYFVMYIQGLAEVLSGWDILMKFEMRKWTSGQQQIAFRVSFVSIALGSATAFFSSSWLYESNGLYGCAYFGVAVGVFNVALPAFYLCYRWGHFDSWREGNKLERIKACRRSQPLMKLLKLDGLDSSSMMYQQSTRKLKLVQTKDKDNIDGANTIDVSNSSLEASSHNRTDAPKPFDNQIGVHYVEPRNYLEYIKELQHQTLDRIMTNFYKFYQQQSSRFLEDKSVRLSDEDVLAAVDPTVLLADSDHIDWPKKFENQISVMKWFCILALALGSTMISSQFAIYSLYLVDVWDVSPIFAGTSMAIGEISGMLTLLFSISLDRWQAKRSIAKERIPQNSKTMKAGTVPDKNSSGGAGWKTLIWSPYLLLQVPSMFVFCCFLSVVPLALLGFLRGPSIEEEEHEEVIITDFSSWPHRLIVILLSGIAIGIINCVMHATTIEMSALLLPDNLFGSAVSYGYSIRRIINLLVCLLATLLYSLSEYMVYQVVACFYLMSVPASIFILASFVKCMPWQKRETILEGTPRAFKDNQSSSLAALNTVNE